MRTLALLLASSLLAFSCAKPNPASPPNIEGRPIEHRALTGSLTSNVKRLLTGSYRSACDDKIEPLRQEIAAALDARAAEIAKLSTSGSTTHREVPFGPTLIRERIARPANVKEGWQEEKTTWEELGELYQAIKNQPVDKKWRALNLLFRGVVVDDLNRVVDGLNFQVTKDAEEPVLRLFTEANECLKAADCVSPVLSAESKAYLAGQLRLQQELREVTTAPNRDTARRELDDFVTWVATDYRFWAFRKNPLMKRVGDHEYELPFDLGVFAPARADFIRHFESAWKAEGRKVTLKTEDSAAVTGAFRAILGTNPGDRSFVDRKGLKLTLEPGFSGEAIAHEMGHVLGFRDVYYSVWDPATCAWTTQYREDDIMSDHNSGRVLDLHWQKLAEEYK